MNININSDVVVTLIDADHYRASNIICERAKLGSTRGKVIEYEEEGKVLL